MSKSVHAIYCDDIRNEAAGKLSFMGVYNSEMFLETFPASLRQFCVFVVIRMPREEAPKKQLSVRLLMKEQVMAEMNIDETALASAPLPSEDEDVPHEDRRLQAHFAFVLNPFNIVEPGVLKLRAIIDGEELKGNGLKIRVASNDERKILNPAQPFD